MANNLTVTPGSGASVAAIADGSSNLWQQILVGYNSAAPTTVDLTHGMPVQPQTASTWTVVGGAASGSALSGNPVLIGGSDGTNARTVATDAAGVLRVGSSPVGTVVTASNTGAATALNTTLAAAASKTTYLKGFAVTGLGATAAGSIQITTTGLTANLTFTLPIPAGVTVGVVPLIVTFDPPLPSSTVNTAVVVNVPSFGAGNTVASVSAWGYQL